MRDVGFTLFKVNIQYDFFIDESLKGRVGFLGGPAIGLEGLGFFVALGFGLGFWVSRFRVQSSKTQ